MSAAFLSRHAWPWRRAAPCMAVADSAAVGWVSEVLAPTTDPRDPLLLSNFFAMLPASGPVALELAAEPERLRLLARAWSPLTAEALAHQLYAALPQARLVPVPPARDPAHPPASGVGRAFTVQLRESEVAPLRTYARQSADPEGDPLAVLVRALQGQRAGERCLVRLTLAPAPEGWQRPYLRLLRDAQPPWERSGPSGAREQGATQAAELFLLAMVGLLVVLLLARFGRQPGVGPWLLGLPLAVQVGGGLAIAGAVLAIVLGGSWLLHRLLGGRGPRGGLVPNQALLSSKLSAAGCLTAIQIWCWAPTEAGITRQIARVGDALRQYSRPDGNRLVIRRLRRGSPERPARLRRRVLRLFGRAPVLSTTELCGLWGPVGGLTDAGDLTRAGSVRRRPPRYGPDGQPWLASGSPLGSSEQGGETRAIAWPAELLGRVTAVIGSTGSGKSTLLAHLAAAAIAEPDRSLVLFDGHSALATAVLGQIPPARQAAVIHLPFGHPTHAPSLNLLDAHAGRAPVQIVEETLMALRLLWPDSWGDRMEQMLRGALWTLVSANTRLPASQQFTLLHVLDLLINPVFRAAVHRHYAPERRNDKFWREFFGTRGELLQQDMINPVLTKLFELYQNPIAQRLIGQPTSTVDLRAAVLAGRIVLVDLAQSVIGADLANIIGSLVMSHVDGAIVSQALDAPAALARGTVIFDEFATMPAINYERIIAQLRKYGFGFVFATQSPSALAKHDPALLAQLRDNCQALLTFRTSAAAATALAADFDGLVRPLDLANLETGCCYVKLEERGLRVPAFWLRVAVPLPGDAALAARLAATSRERHARALPSAEAAIEEMERWVDAVGEAELGAYQAERVSRPAKSEDRRGKSTQNTADVPAPSPEVEAPLFPAATPAPGAAGSAAPPEPGPTDRPAPTTAPPPPTPPATAGSAGASSSGGRPAKPTRRSPRPTRRPPRPAAPLDASPEPPAP